MGKLSRTARYQELRDRLDEETTKAQTTPEQPIRLTRSGKNTAPGAHANGYYSLSQSELSFQNSKPTDVLDELLGEVKQYNIEQGERVIEDTQFNILETLDKDTEINSRRQSHLEPMEKAQNPGETTMNIDAVDIRTISSKPQEDSTYLDELSIEADPQVDPDNLQVFDLGADDFDRTIRQTKKTSQKKAPSRRKERKQQPKQEVVEEQDTDKESSFGFVNILLAILIVILLASIAFTVYMIFQAGIL